MTAASHEEGWVESADGLKLFWRRSIPRRPRAVLLFVHGLAEHAGRYQNPIDHFTPRGFGCYAFDYRGHGKSPGLRVHVNRFDEFLLDLEAALRLARAEHPALAVIPVGHSHGGLVLLRYALERASELTGLVVSSPFLGIHPASAPPAALAAAAHVLSRIVPKLRLPNNVDASFVSRDADVVRRYVEDPLVSRRVSVRWFTAFRGAAARVLREADRFDVPSLVMASGDDRLVDVEATRRWVARAPRHRVTFVEWEGLYHEMFNEPEKEKVFRKMEAWIEALLA